jgi:rubrerythrin
MKFTLAQLEEKAKQRPQGYREEVLALSVKINEDLYEIDNKSFEHIAQKYRLPSMLERIRSFAQAVNVAAAMGLESRDSQETEEVLLICARCPYLIPEKFTCGKCGCFLAIKSRFRNFRCPENKW